MVDEKDFSCSRRERQRNKQMKKLFQSSSFTFMVSFYELQELFLLSHFHGYLNDEELLLLYEEYSPKIQIFLTRIVAGFHSKT